MENINMISSKKEINNTIKELQIPTISSSDNKYETMKHLLIDIRRVITGIIINRSSGLLPKHVAAGQTLYKAMDSLVIAANTGRLSYEELKQYEDIFIYGSIYIMSYELKPTNPRYASNERDKLLIEADNRLLKAHRQMGKIIKRTENME
jgi:hypothetical protein